jgi:putative phosphoesterase
MKIGVISDTHNFFDPKIHGLFAGVEHILHAGDIGQPAILAELETIAPVTAVMGNTDDAGFRYPLTKVVSLCEKKFLVHHIVNPHSLEDDLAERIKREAPSVVVFGHTHKPFRQMIDGITFFNPGYAGKARFGMERSLAIFHCAEKEVRHQYFSL